MNALRMRGHRRPISILIVGLAVLAGTAIAQPKKGKTPAKGTPPKGSAQPSDSGEIEMGPDDAKKGSAKGGSKGSDVNPDEIEMGDEGSGSGKPNLEQDLATSANTGPVKVEAGRKTPLSWEDILVVVRKPFLKVRRTELLPFVATTMNDNMIRHYAIGGELAYYLTDALAIGVEGQYYTHQFNEPFDLVARQARRLPTVNQYNWSAALDFHYVPIYGKFAILDHRLVTWEVLLTAGLGAGQSEVIPRDTHFPGFTNLLIEPNVGGAMRFFLAKWVTISAGVRDYIFYDHFEPTNRDVMTNATAAEAAAHADGSLINNIMFQIGLSFWLPTSFEYTTFR